MMRSGREEQARTAAESILRSQISLNYGSTSNYSSRSSLYNEQITSSLPILSTSSSCCSRYCIVSHERRTFCLLVTFDLLLSFVLWIMYVKLKGGNFIEDMKDEFRLYTYYNSFVDFLMLGLLRFIMLLMFYGLLRIMNPSVVAITTFITSLHVILKICLFKNGNMVSYILLGETFVMSWLQTWFMDFRVLPYEKACLDRIGSSQNTEYSQDTLHINVEPEDFRTPTEGSDEEDDSNLDSAELLYMRRVRDCWKTSHMLLGVKQGWKRENATEGVTVHSQHFKSYGKVFRAEAVIDCQLNDVFLETTLESSKIHKWNKTIVESRVIKQLTDNSDIIYHATANTGIVKSRDFVSVRLWKPFKEDGSMLSVSTSVNVPTVPPNKQHVRGETLLAAWSYEYLPNNQCLLKMLVSSDIKGWIPQPVVDQALSGIIIDTLNNLKLHMKNVQKKQNIK